MWNIVGYGGWLVRFYCDGGGVWQKGCRRGGGKAGVRGRLGGGFGEGRMVWLGGVVGGFCCGRGGGVWGEKWQDGWSKVEGG